MDLRSPHHDTTVGRVEIPRMLFATGQHRSLSGSLTGTSFVQANSARRRLYGPTLLSSPPRRGHTPKMADIFSSARANIGNKRVPAIQVTSPSLASRDHSIRTRGDSSLNTAMLPTTGPKGTNNNNSVLYPALPSEDDDDDDHYDDETPIRKAGGTLPPSIHGLENERQILQMSRIYAQCQTSRTQSQTPRLSPQPGSRSHSYFNKPPQIALAQIVAMNEIETIQKQENLSSSSVSWTGDSQFYIPQHRMLVLPPQERKRSVPEWLEQLPPKPDEFEQATESGDEEVVPLSPDVETERGSMRRRMRSGKGRKRCLSFSDETYS